MIWPRKPFEQCSNCCTFGTVYITGSVWILYPGQWTCSRNNRHWKVPDPTAVQFERRPPVYVRIKDTQWQSPVTPWLVIGREYNNLAWSGWNLVLCQHPAICWVWWGSASGGITIQSACFMGKISHRSFLGTLSCDIKNKGHPDVNDAQLTRLRTIRVMQHLWLHGDSSAILGNDWDSCVRSSRFVEFKKLRVSILGTGFSAFN